jgi:hypothetical protein
MSRDNNMQCRDFEHLLNDLLDQRLNPQRDSRLLRHTEKCLSCHQLLQGQAALLAGLELGEFPPPSSQFAAAVLVQACDIPVAAVAVTRRGGTKKWARVMAGFVSLAVIVLVAVLIGLPRQQHPFRPTAGKPASSAAPFVTVEVARDLPSPQKAAPLAVVKSVTPPEFSPTAPEKEDYQEYRVMFDSLAAQLPGAVEKMDEVQQATPAIRPIRASFSLAIGTLQRTIPNRTKRDTRPIKPDSGSYAHHREIVA